MVSSIVAPCAGVQYLLLLDALRRHGVQFDLCLCRTLERQRQLPNKSQGLINYPEKLLPLPENIQFVFQRDDRILLPLELLLLLTG